MFFMFLIIKLNFLNVNMFSKSFLKNFFHIYLGEIFLALLHELPLCIYPGNFFAFTTRDPTSLFEFSRFSNNSHKWIFMHCKNHARKSEFTECGNLYNFSQTLGMQFAYRYVMHNYNNSNAIIHYIQFLYCIHLQTCIQLIYCMLNVCGYWLNCQPFLAPFQLYY